MNVCVFAASSSRINSVYKEAASELGKLLAESGMNILYGGGGIGLMGSLADAAIEKGGTITGVLPEFMKAEGWGHEQVSEMIVTGELTEAITLKQLGLYKGPIIILNTSGFYNSLIIFLEELIAGHFLRLEHKDIWQVVNTPPEAIRALADYKGWMDDPRTIARIC
jgi:predicted Rossmann-fold nucleotide-binding protein